jgi:putative peptidoglycan lipid II flippase
VVVGGVVQMVICAVPYVRSGETRLSLGTPLVEAGQPALKRVGRASGPIALAGVLGQLRAVVDQILASILFVPGSIGALYQAYRLMQLPFGIFGLAVSREAFPAMIEEATSHGGESFSRAVVRALRLNMFFMVPAMVGLVVLATPFVRLMFERGRFTAEHTELTAVALVCYAVGLVALGEQAVLSRAFYALLNTRTPFYLGALAVIGKVLLSLLLARTPLRHGGLALATSVASWLQAWLLLAMLGRELKRQGRRLTLEGLWSGLAHTTVCGAVMAACTWATLLALQRFVGARGFWGSALCVGVPGLVGLVAYLGTAVVVRCEEARHFRWWRRNVDRTRGSG